MKRIAVLPSLLTLGNAFCGILAICYTADALLYSLSPGLGGPAVFHSKVNGAAWLIFLAMIFDALDGKVARLANLTSDFGGQLDSLCDAISFGVAPAFLAKVLWDHERIAQGLTPIPKLIFLAAVPFALCAILRLARFNVENEQGDDAHKYFKGLPTPGAAGAIASLVLMYEGFATSKPATLLTELFPGFDPNLFVHFFGSFLLPVVLVLLGLLMVSRVTYVHFFNFAFRGRKSFAFLIQLILLLGVAAVEVELALALVFCGYVASGPLLSLRREKFGKSSEEVEEEKKAPF